MTIDSPSKDRSKLPARDRILLAAHDLFYAEGIRATGIDRIIAEAGVTKVTFYRHFPSKNDLILAFLDYRHERWMAWFKGALARNAHLGGGALVPALGEWFAREDFRGCAFINTVVEVGGTIPEAREVSRRHKEDMTAAIADILPEAPDRQATAKALALVVDGAIIRAQYEGDGKGALGTLMRVVAGLT
ncbi:mycofactocin system transcriptional regulator [Hartmannibacter diazotrophicus]|uniref:Mycofactocin system transcriptional regulator n=1 Tax=Hartmannibacter diazotrophicus TaxID=1482074 RepID=A0A2C9D0H6_9HYPH|nr:TetR/AcrR family transcriptional regulator [Hartmannibacter diazotrophicus]SON53668.1 mycofactocin system transcriptional regulator [Hartmannibacter diazotrophicus]